MELVDATMLHIGLLGQWWLEEIPPGRGCLDQR